MSRFEIHHGDSLAVLPGLAADSIDAIVTDPPYGIGFMGKEWDTFTPSSVAAESASRERKGTNRPPSSRRPRMAALTQGGGVPIRYDESPSAHRRFQAWCETWAREALRVAKPGAWILVSGGSRTFHRAAAGIEDAGWEIRDCLSWLYGSGFPKSRNGAWGGTALKPGWEPIILARKPLAGTVAANHAEHGTGGLNIDGCRIAGPKPDTTRGAGGANGAYSPLGAQGRIEDDGRGRWPANVLLDEDAAAELDRQSGDRQSGEYGLLGGNGIYNAVGPRPMPEIVGDFGGASRFFYTAKASRAEREAGLDGFEPVRRTDGRHVEAGQTRNDDPRIRTAARVNHHPTVKPVDLMRWLVRLVTPLGGLVLDPFLGSGTTGVAALEEGCRFVGIEREADYVAIARARIQAADRSPLLPFGDTP